MFQLNSSDRDAFGEILAGLRRDFPRQSPPNQAESIATKISRIEARLAEMAATDSTSRRYRDLWQQFFNITSGTEHPSEDKLDQLLEELKQKH